MRIVLTLVVRDEDDILEENLDYHLDAGVDFVIVTDHRSEDRTPEILERYRREGVLRVLREDGQFIDQKGWQTRMVLLAVAEHGADWVILGDADEFWWPRGGSLPEAIACVPAQFGSVRGLQHNFVPVHGGDAAFAERMVVRLSTAAPINDTATPFRPVAKVAVRASPDLRLGRGGGHRVLGIRGEPLEAWSPVEVLHYPFRSEDQCARKYRNTWTGWEANLRGDLARARRTADANDSGTMWRRLALDDAAVRRGLSEGTLIVDVRLRDALRALPGGRGGSGARSGPSELGLHQLDAAGFAEAELVRRQRWVDDLGRRVHTLEERPRAARRHRSA